MVQTEYLIGIDIGGSKTNGVLWDGRKIIKTIEIKTPQKRGAFESVIKKVITFLSDGCKIGGVGIGTAGVVEGTILKLSPNIPKIKNFDFRKLCRIFDIRHLKVDNDARCFARAEYLLGAGSRARKKSGGLKRVFFLTIGTGIGRSFGRDRKILKIKKFEYPERWEKEYQLIYGNDSKLSGFLGKSLSKLIKPYKPDAIIIGGGVALDHKNFVQKLRAEFQKNGLKSKVLKSRLGKHSVALGAALLFNKLR